MADTTYNEGHPTISGDFNNSYNQPFAVRNAQANYQERSAATRLARYIDNKSSVIKRTGARINKQNRSVLNNNERVRAASSNLYKAGAAGKQMATSIRQAKATSTSIAVVSWTMFLWVWVLLPLNLVVLFLFGAAYMLQGTWTGYFLSYAVDLNTLFLWFWYILIGVAASIHIGALMHYYFARLSPLFGHGAEAKICSFLLSFISAIFPGAAIIPTILLWEWLVEVYPK